MTSGALTISGAFTGTAGLTTAGTGVLTLSNASYTGATTINSGQLILFNATAYNSPTTINTGGKLSISGNTTLNMASTTATYTINGGTLENINPANWTVIDGAVIVSGTATINQTSNATGASGEGLFLDGGLKGSGTVTINATNAGNGVNFRNNNSTFSGSMIVNGIASATAYAGSGIGVGGCTTGLQNADITLNGTMELLNQGIAWADSASGAFKMGALSGSGVMIGNFTSSGGGTTVTIGNTNNNGTFSGVIANGSGNVVSIVKIGTGVQTFSGTNTYSNGTTINAGTLKLDLTSRSTDTALNLGTITTTSPGILELYTNASPTNYGLTALTSTGTTFNGNGTINKTGQGIVDFWSPGSGGTSIKNFTGLIDVQAGTLADQTTSDWSTSAGAMNLEVDAGAYFDLRTDSAVVNSLSGSGTIGSSYNTETLTVGAQNGSATFSGVIQNTVPGFTNNGQFIALKKSGTGVQVLSGGQHLYRRDHRQRRYAPVRQTSVAVQQHHRQLDGHQYHRRQWRYHGLQRRRHGRIYLGQYRYPQIPGHGQRRV